MAHFNYKFKNKIFLFLLSLISNDSNQKSRFIDSTQASNSNGTSSMSNQNYQRNAVPNTTNISEKVVNINEPQNVNSNANTSKNNFSEKDHFFDKILNEIIHVNDRTITLESDISSSHPVQDMPFKIKGLLEPTNQRGILPEGVPVPVTVLSAQPPFISDIRLINNLAQEAYNCINNFSLYVPENVAFDFNPSV